MREIASKLTRRSFFTALAVVLVAGALAFAGQVPANWKVGDGGKRIAQRPASGADYVVLTNLGKDPVTVKAKGASITKSGVLPPGFRGSVLMPQGSKAVVIKDAEPGDNEGSRGVILWASSGLGQSATGNNGDLLTAPIV
jgi:hypothetical protein